MAKYKVSAPNGQSINFNADGRSISLKQGAVIENDGWVKLFPQLFRKIEEEQPKEIKKETKVQPLKETVREKPVGTETVLEETVREKPVETEKVLTEEAPKRQYRRKRKQ